MLINRVPRGSGPPRARASFYPKRRREATRPPARPTSASAFRAVGRRIRMCPGPSGGGGPSPGRPADRPADARTLPGDDALRLHDPNGRGRGRLALAFLLVAASAPAAVAWGQ